MVIVTTLTTTRTSAIIYPSRSLPLPPTRTLSPSKAGNGVYELDGFASKHPAGPSHINNACNKEVFGWGAKGSHSSHEYVSPGCTRTATMGYGVGCMHLDEEVAQGDGVRARYGFAVRDGWMDARMGHDIHISLAT